MSFVQTPNSGKVDFVSSPASASSAGRGLFTRDLMAKSRAEFLNNSSKPYLIVAGDSVGATRWYESSETILFFDDLAKLFLSGDGNIWVDIDFSGLSEDKFKYLCEEILHLHELTTRDCFVEDRTVTDTKVSLFPEYLIVYICSIVWHVSMAN